MTNQEEIMAAVRELNAAILDDNISLVDSLLESRPQLLTHTTMLGTCLHIAIQHGTSRIVKHLIAIGADVDAIAELGGTPLRLAASEGTLESVKDLIAAGARFVYDSPDTNTLFGTIFDGHAEIAKLLIEAGCDPHVVYRGESGQLKNALSYAVERDHSALRDILSAAGCKLPVEGVDVPVNEATSKPADHFQPVDSVKEVLKHLTSSIGPVEPLALQEVVPVHDDVHISVNVIKPNENCPFTTVFTTGMSDVAMAVPEGQEEFQYAELLMYLPGDWEIPQLDSNDEASLWPFQWLRNAAYLPHQNDTWLGGPHTIISSDAPPVPLGPNTDMTCLLLNADMAEWSPLELSDGRKIRFYTAMPIYTEERDLEVEYGVIALMQKFEEIGIPPIVFPGRPNVGEIKG